MESETALVIVTFCLLLATSFYAWITFKMLKEQQRAIEYQIKPAIEIVIENKTLFFEVSKNDAYGLNTTVTLNGISDKQELGTVLVGTDSPVRSKSFNLGELIGKVGEGSSATLTVRIEYQSFSCHRYCEEFDYHCSITERGLQIKPHQKLPINRRLIKGR